MPEITVAAGKKYLVTSDARRADLEELAARLGSGGVDVTLDITEYEPGRRGLSFNQPEAVVIYLAGAGTTALISRLAGDVYDKAKAWALQRFQKKVDAKPDGLHRPEEFTIYGPEGDVLKHWKIDDDGEHES